MERRRRPGAGRFPVVLSSCNDKYRVAEGECFVKEVARFWQGHCQLAMALIPNPQLLYNPLVMTSPIDLDAFIARWAASGAAERANFQSFATQKSKDVSHINIMTFVSCHAFA